MFKSWENRPEGRVRCRPTGAKARNRHLESHGHVKFVALGLVLLIIGGKSQFANTHVAICKFFSSKGLWGSSVIVYVAIQGWRKGNAELIREDG